MERIRKVPISFAPMEGITDSLYRKVHCSEFGFLDKYYIPFVSTNQNYCWTPKQLKCISPEYNTGINAVPQILTNNSSQFIWAAKWLIDAGYSEINLNAGCPSGTVTAKRKGSGMLLDIGEYRRFLDNIFVEFDRVGESPVISIKSRIGFYTPEEAKALAELYADYPMKELIIHPRTRQEFYKGEPHRETMQLFSDMPFDVTYNGDIMTANDITAITEKMPFISRVMIGRGLVGNPFLAREYYTGEKLTIGELRAYWNSIKTKSSAVFPPQAVYARLRELISYICCFIELNHPAEKALKKSRTLEELDYAAQMIFTCSLTNNPSFEHL